MPRGPRPIQVRDVPFVDQSVQERDYRDARFLKQMMGGLLVLGMVLYVIFNHG